jgi:hypothetical protein
VKPGAVKAASPVFNGGDEETGLCRPRLVATQLECEISQELFQQFPENLSRKGFAPIIG